MSQETDKPARTMRTKGEQVRDIIHDCGRTQLREVATVLRRECSHELGILLEELDR